MKRVVIGGFLSLIGSIWALAALLVGCAYMDRVGSWSTPPGRYGTAMLASGMAVPLAVGGILLLLGLASMAVEYFRKEK